MTLKTDKINTFERPYSFCSEPGRDPNCHIRQRVLELKVQHKIPKSGVHVSYHNVTIFPAYYELFELFTVKYLSGVLISTWSLYPGS